MQQTYYCPTCGQQVSYGLRFCGNCGNPLTWKQQTPPSPIYQQPVNYEQQVSPSYQQHPSYPRQQQYRMNWFQRHLNWTWVLSYLLMLVGAFMFGFLMFLADPNISEDAVGGVAEIFGSIFMLVVSGWVIKQKGRSLWWLLLSGLFSPLWLSNKKTEREPLNS